MRTNFLTATLVILTALSAGSVRAEAGHGVGAMQPTSRTAQLAEYFGRPMSDLVPLRDQGFGYAEITKILVIARMSRQPIAALLARHRDGYGWGTISRGLGLNTVDVKRSVDQVRRDLGIVSHPEERQIK